MVSGRHNDEGQKLTAELRKLGTEAEFVRTGGMIAGCKLWGRAFLLFVKIAGEIYPVSPVF